MFIRKKTVKNLKMQSTIGIVLGSTGTVMSTSALIVQGVQYSKLNKRVNELSDHVRASENEMTVVKGAVRTVQNSLKMNGMLK